jgi:predicted short-subunit dehydrogenase-like oxidoreductase (DUF2520 family)
VRALREGRVAVKNTAGRAPAPAAVRTADIVVLAVPDPAIEPTAAMIAPWLGRASIVLHVAGSRGPEALLSCREAGAAIGVLHPLVSFAGPKQAPPLRGATFVIDGDREAMRAARRLAGALGARVLAARVHGPAYHAAASLAANGTVGLAAIAVDVWARLGLSRRSAERAVASLLESVVRNLAQVGLPDALTGPIVRGDAETVTRHRRALRAHPSAARAYDALAPAILEVARSAGLDEAAAGRIEAALGGRRRRSRREPR